MNYLNAKIAISRIFLSYNCDLVFNPFICSIFFNEETTEASLIFSASALDLTRSGFYLILLQIFTALLHY